MKFNELSPAALKAAMEGGTEAWGQHGSILRHRLYVEPQDARGGHYLKCRCGCGRKAKFRLMANGVWARAASCQCIATQRGRLGSEPLVAV
jgi:hypothetical protein